jgi:hypothetical protein
VARKKSGDIEKLPNVRSKSKTITTDEGVGDGEYDGEDSRKKAGVPQKAMWCERTRSRRFVAPT